MYKKIKSLLVSSLQTRVSMSKFLYLAIVWSHSLLVDIQCLDEYCRLSVPLKLHLCFTDLPETDLKELGTFCSF